MRENFVKTAKLVFILFTLFIVMYIGIDKIREIRAEVHFKQGMERLKDTPSHARGGHIDTVKKDTLNKSKWN